MLAKLTSHWYQLSLRLLTALLILTFLAAGLIWTLIPQVTDCGGNNPVTTIEKMYLQMIYVSALDSPDHQFAVTKVSAEMHQVFQRIQNNADGELLVSTKSYKPDSIDGDEVVIVCSQSFTNRPRFWFQQRVPKHAVGYADGRVELLTVPQFAKLDKSHLVPLKDVLADKKND
jgi:hypothetical protein